MESSTKKLCYFSNHVGPTLETLSFFPVYKAITLLKRLNTKCAAFANTHANNIFGVSLPSVFLAEFKHTNTIKGENPDRFCYRILHLRDALFLTLYSTNELEII
jgi:hypothetical protein